MSEKANRFEKASKDPRFRKAAVAERKVVIDERFSKVLKDKNFSTKTSASRVKGLPKQAAESESENEQRRFYAAAEEAEEFHWSAESSESEISDAEPQTVVEDESGAVWSESEKSFGESVSRKLSVMHCNWEKITATDLFMMFQTFLKGLAASSKSIVSVAIYLSDFGASELEYERQHGPRLELAKTVTEEELSRMTPEQQDVHKADLNEAVRKYQKKKLKYYYAIAEFDSQETAELVYNELDGLTASFCAASLDLRFVPEDLEIPREPVSFSDRVAENFRPAAFDDGGAAVGLENSTVKLTWDEDPPERKILRRKFNAQEIMDLELNQYLASSSDEEADQRDRDAYRRALLGDDLAAPTEATAAASSSGEDEEMGEMELRVNKDMEALGKRIASGESKDKKELSTWNKYLEKRKEQRKDKKLQRKMERSEKVDERQNFLKGDDLKPFVATKRKIPEQPTVSVAQDDRLKKLFENPDFAIDTTAPQFDKKSTVLKEVIQEKAKRSRKHKVSNHTNSL